MGWAKANSTEIDAETPYPVVIDMPEHNSGQMGGTMRLGQRTTIFHGESITSKLTSGLVIVSTGWKDVSKADIN